MTHSGDAAEQIVRMSLEGVEVAARITGTAAKEIALLLLAALKSPDKATGGLKLKGKERLTSMLKSGKALEIFSVKERDLKTFVQEAKRYGIVYCVLRNSKNAPDGLCDIMVKADDAPKINRLVERFKFAAVDKAKIESEIVQDMAARTEQTADTPAEPIAKGADSEVLPTDLTGEPEAPEINDIDALLDELLGADEGKTTPEKTEAEKAADVGVVDKGAADKAGTDTPAPDTAAPDAPIKTVPSKTVPDKPAPKKGGRGAKKEPTPATDAKKGEADPGRLGEQRPEGATSPLASGGESRTDSPNPPSPAENLVSDSPPPKTSPSKPSSDSRKNSERRFWSKRPSVKEEIAEITAMKKAKEAETVKGDEPLTPTPAKPKETPIKHNQPQNRRKPKSKKSKGR